MNREQERLPGRYATEDSEHARRIFEQGRQAGLFEAGAGSGERVRWLLMNLAIELNGALEKFDPFNSPHEGWAVIREELDELWDHVKANTGRGPDAYLEALQTAAMALRYAHDLMEWGPTAALPGTGIRTTE